MTNKVQSALEILCTDGPVALTTRSANFIINEIPPFEQLMLKLSVRRLQKIQRCRYSLEDLLDITGYNHYDNESIRRSEFIEPEGAAHDRQGVTAVPGEYTGFGKFKSIKMSQGKESMHELAVAVEEFSPSVVLEIGTAKGGTLYLWSRFLDSVDHVLSLDIDYRNRDEFFQVFTDDADLTFIEGDSHAGATVSTVRHQLNGDTIDFLYIDADHSYEGVKRDFSLYSELLSEDAIVGLHDIAHPGTGVSRFWEELCAEYETKEFGSGIAKNGLVYL
jgi:cephalosporin hydroxylase